MKFLLKNLILLKPTQILPNNFPSKASQGIAVDHKIGETRKIKVYL